MELFKLTVEHYVSGPVTDRDRAGDDPLWVFGMMIGNKEAYIKLKIVRIPGEEQAICISFHEAGFPQVYPYQESEGDEF